ncbi:MAG: hypothetical protein F6K47_21260 [Symploca sp. SIO2E6]|nr:hypothetical protein [Symploca sp. SIO2E6]
MNTIFTAIRQHNLELVAEMLKSGIEVNTHLPNPPCWTPLQEAIDELDDGGSVQIVELLLQSQADVNAWDLLQNSNPLLMAIWGEHDDVLQILLQAGANPNIRDQEGNSPLRLSVEQENINMVKLLLEHGAKATIDDAGGFRGMNALGIAVSKLNIAIVEMLLNAGANSEVIDHDYRKPLQRIPEDADTKIKEKLKDLLLQYQCDRFVVA